MPVGRRSAVADAVIAGDNIMDNRLSDLADRRKMLTALKEQATSLESQAAKYASAGDEETANTLTQAATKLHKQGEKILPHYLDAKGNISWSEANQSPNEMYDPNKRKQKNTSDYVIAWNQQQGKGYIDPISQQANAQKLVEKDLLTQMYEKNIPFSTINGQQKTREQMMKEQFGGSYQQLPETSTYTKTKDEVRLPGLFGNEIVIPEEGTTRSAGGDAVMLNPDGSIPENFFDKQSNMQDEWNARKTQIETQNAQFDTSNPEYRDWVAQQLAELNSQQEDARRAYDIQNPKATQDDRDKFYAQLEKQKNDQLLRLKENKQRSYERNRLNTINELLGAFMDNEFIPKYGEHVRNAVQGNSDRWNEYTGERGK